MLADLSFPILRSGTPFSDHRPKRVGRFRGRCLRRRVGRPKASDRGLALAGPPSSSYAGWVPANRYELLATWYLRLNGYFTVPDFVVHKDYRNRPGGTDADVLAVRFPHSCEYQRRFEFDHDPGLVTCGDKIDFIVCEVKKGRCDLNETWLMKERQNVEYAIRWMGLENDDAKISQIANEMYSTGICESASNGSSVRFVAIGSTENPGLKQHLPRVTQIPHAAVIEFLRRRFVTGCEGINRQNWDPAIVEFAELCNSADSEGLQHWAEEGSN